jgi:alpha-ketoglutarate-dependent taurine dioxygenase
VFLRDQKITPKQQEELATKLGELSGKPATSKLHIHPMTAEFSELGDTTNVIDLKFNSIGPLENGGYDDDDKSTLASNGWHTE